MLFVGELQLAYTLRSHKKYRSVGHLWQDRFKSFVVERAAYLLSPIPLAPQLTLPRIRRTLFRTLRRQP